MLTITVPAAEFWNPIANEFINTKTCVLALEHSLVSISKWESKWNKPFLSKNEKTDEEMIDYIRCMTLTQNVDPQVYYALTSSNYMAIKDYIDAPMTATTFPKDSEKQNREIVTSELIYYWMIASGIPFECQKWHINRLLTLIRVCGIKNSPKKKMSRKDAMNQQRMLNAQRRSKWGSKG